MRGKIVAQTRSVAILACAHSATLANISWPYLSWLPCVPAARSILNPEATQLKQSDSHNQAEAETLTAEERKLGLEADEIERRLDQKWYQGRVFLQTVIPGTVAFALVLSWGIATLPSLWDTQREKTELELKKLSLENEIDRLTNEKRARELDNKADSLQRENIKLGTERDRLKADTKRLLTENRNYEQLLAGREGELEERVRLSAVESEEKAALEDELESVKAERAATAARTERLQSGMVLVPAGVFTMGSNEGRWSDEKPLHQVYLDAFYLDKHEVTNSQYADFLSEKGNLSEGGAEWLEMSEYVLIDEKGGSFSPKSGFGNHPVIEVSWYGAKAFCEWKNKRLPTEAEWEKAARGTDGRAYPWGKDFGSGNANSSGDGDGYARTAPVGSFPSGASPYVVHDMSGNVWEWCADWYADYVNESKKGVSRNPKGPDRTRSRVVRGGSWFNNPNYLRSAFRSRSNPDYRSNFVGFRCARTR